MTPPFERLDLRMRQLAVDELTMGLAAAERAELRARVDPRELEELERAIAELHVAALGPLEAPPPELMARIAADARAWLAARPAS